MGGLLSYVLGPPEDPTLNEVDEATGLTGKEKAVIKSTWATVMQDPKTHGIGVFILLFKTDPSSQNLFKSFRGKSLDRIAKSVTMRAHATTVMQSLDAIVESLDDPGCLVALLHKLGQNHHARGVTRKLFDMVADVIVDYLKSQLPLDDFTTSSWRKALTTINDVAAQAMVDDFEES